MDNIEIVNCVVESGFKETQLTLLTKPGTLICFGLSNFPIGRTYKSGNRSRPIFCLSEISLNDETVMIMTIVSVKDRGPGNLVITMLETSQIFWCHEKDLFYTKSLELPEI